MVPIKAVQETPVQIVLISVCLQLKTLANFTMLVFGISRFAVLEVVRSDESAGLLPATADLKPFTLVSLN